MDYFVIKQVIELIQNLQICFANYFDINRLQLNVKIHCSNSNESKLSDQIIHKRLC